MMTPYKTSDKIINKYKKFLEGKKIIAVSSAPHMIGSKSRKFIESYDIVVRFNQSCSIIKKFKKDLGRRTDILYTSFGDSRAGGFVRNKTLFKLEEELRNGLKWVCCPSPYVINRIKNFNERINYKDKVNIYVVSSDIRSELIEKIEFKSYKHQPTTGLMAIYDLLKYNIKELYLAGFTFYKKVIGEDRYYFPEYQDAYRGPGRGNKKHPLPSLHPPDIEFDFFKKICLQDSRVKYDEILKKLIEIY